jgi:hypothetical protein
MELSVVLPNAGRRNDSKFDLDVPGDRDLSPPWSRIDGRSRADRRSGLLGVGLSRAAVAQLATAARPWLIGGVILMFVSGIPQGNEDKPRH